jgi:hypothetical protein
MDELKESLRETGLEKTPDALLILLKKATEGMNGNEGAKWTRFLIHTG